MISNSRASGVGTNDIDRMIIIAVYCLAIAHPGPIFKDTPSALARNVQHTGEPKV